MTRHRLFKTDDAASGIFSFLVAGVLLVGFVGTALHTTQGFGSSENAQTASLSTQAQSLLSVVMESRGSSTGADWIAMDEQGYISGPESVTRLGLADAQRPGYVSFDKLRNLALAPKEADAGDGFVNYPEAREGLLPHGGLDFHLRAYPTLKSVQEVLAGGVRDQNLRVAYIGSVEAIKAGPEKTDDEPSAAPDLEITGLTCTNGASPDSVVVAYSFTNTGGTQTHFTSVVNLAPPTGPQHSDDVNHPILASGESWSVTTVVPTNGANWCAAGTEIEVRIYDPTSLVDTARRTLVTSLAGVADHGAAVRVDTEYPYYLAGEPVWVYWDGPGLKNQDTIQIIVNEGLDGQGTAIFDSGNRQAGSNNDRNAFVGTPPAGNYRVTLVHDGLATYDHLIVTAWPLPDYQYADDDEDVVDEPTTFTPASSLESEVAMIEALVHGFCAKYNDGSALSSLPAPAASRCEFLPSALTQGSVYPDLKSIMNRDLPLILEGEDGQPRYDIVNTLVVGSDADHSAMTSQAAKGRIEKWVLGGGDLIVLGSAAQSLQWLQPLFHAGTQTSNGELYAPDPTHPVLTTSEMLDWSSYSSHGRSWKYSAGAQEYFMTVVEEGGEDVTAVSNPGAFGTGSIILTTWQPFDLYGTGAPSGLEGTRLVNNLLMYGYTGLYLDYGPPLPAGVETIPSYRLVNVDHPELGPVQMSFILFVWQA